MRGFYRSIFGGNNVNSRTTSRGKAKLQLMELENRVVPSTIVAMSLSNTTAPAFQPAGTVVGTFSTVDGGSGNTFTYSLAQGANATGNSEFMIAGNALETADSLNPGTQSSYNILVNVKDQNNQSFQQAFTINVSNNSPLSQSGTVLTITAPSQTNSVAITADASQDTVVLNGKTYTIDANTVSTINYIGQGSDTATITGASTGANTFAMGPTGGTVNGPGYQINLSGVSNISAVGGVNDTVNMYDSTGNNTFTASPTSSTLTGNNFTETATGFGHVNAIAGVGTNDNATLYDAAGNNTFVAMPTYAFLEGTNYDNLAAGFKTVTAYKNAGSNDVGYLYDTNGTNVFTARPGNSSLTQAGVYFNQTVGFNAVTAFSAPSANDTANLYDEAGQTNVFVGTPTDAHMQGPNFFKQAVGFNTVNAFSSSNSTNYAYLSDTTGSNTFYGSPTSSSLSGTGYTLNANGFASVQANAATGTNDTANFVGSTSGGNGFEATTGYSYMYGPGFVASVYGFRTVSAKGTIGDTATLYDGTGPVTGSATTPSVGGITFTGSGDTGTLEVYNQTFSVMGFGYVNVVQQAGNSDQAIVNNIDYTLTKVGTFNGETFS